MTEQRLERMEQDITEIKGAVIGNPRVGQKGLVGRVGDLEEAKKKADLRAAYIAGGVAVAVAMAKHFLNL